MSTNFKTVSSSHITISELMLPSHTNFSGKIHGGYILSLMDQIAFACGSKFCGNYCVTASVDTVNFLKPIEVGALVTMKASVNYVGNSSMIVGIRVESENIQTGTVNDCNSSYFTLVSNSSWRRFSANDGGRTDHDGFDDFGHVVHVQGFNFVACFVVVEFVIHF